MADITSNQSGFPLEQAAILQDLARNGAADGANIYGYPDMGSNMQSNGLSNSYQEMDDGTALLESLAAFEHPSTSVACTSVSNSNDHFASLLQAAATAEGAEIAQAEISSEQHNASQIGGSDEYDFFKRTFPAEPRSKRNRRGGGIEGIEPSAESEDGRSYGLVPNKRRNRTPSPESPSQLAREREIWGPEEDEDKTDNEVSVADDTFQQTPLSTAEARALGVHSAAALFRRASKASTKYARPPMSKLYLSLQLAPEQFIEMQKAAKNYMLDKNHPERRECVGTKGSGDSDVVRVRLFNTVKAFLDDGWGERCFGENSPSGTRRKYKWPEHSTKLTQAVTPLLRRMVTNERQRLYALETRQEKRKAGEKINNKRKRDQTATSESEGTPGRKRGRQGNSPSPYHDVDPKLDEYRYHVEETYPEEAEDGMSKSRTGQVVENEFSVEQPDESNLRYHLSILQNGQRIKPRLTLSPSSCPGFASLVQYIHTLLDDTGQKPSSVSILTPHGLVEVNSEESWEAAVSSIMGNDWMDGEVRCVAVLEGEL